MMTPEQTRRVRRSLLDRWLSARERTAAELHDELEQTRLRNTDPDQLAADPTAVALPAACPDHARELESIVHALRRLRSGVYGHCIVCNEWISAERIEASPEAVACERCAPEDTARPAARA
jgi:RNA polymerase-binding transcription factor DksA